MWRPAVLRWRPQRQSKRVWRAASRRMRAPSIRGFLIEVVVAADSGTLVPGTGAPRDSVSCELHDRSWRDVPLRRYTVSLLLGSCWRRRGHLRQSRSAYCYIVTIMDATSSALYATLASPEATVRQSPNTSSFFFTAIAEREKRVPFLLSAERKTHMPLRARRAQTRSSFIRRSSSTLPIPSRRSRRACRPARSGRRSVSRMASTRPLTMSASSL